MTQPNGQYPSSTGAATPADLAAAVEAARRSAEAAQLAAEASLQATRATLQIAETLRALAGAIPRVRPGAEAGPASNTPHPLPTLPPIPHDTQVAIIAAVAVALRGRHYRVRRIHMAEQPSHAWGQMGRTEILESHTRSRWK